MMKLSGKEFKATIIKMLQQAIVSSLETNENMQSISKELENRKEPKGNYVTKKIIIGIKICRVDSVIEWK